MAIATPAALNATAIATAELYASLHETFNMERSFLFFGGSYMLMKMIPEDVVSDLDKFSKEVRVMRDSHDPECAAGNHPDGCNCD